MDLNELLLNGAKVYGVELSDAQLNQFMMYKDLLKEWNEKINLTAITDDDGIVKKHFIDSISILKSGIIEEDAYLIDVGTGAGFPGIPLKIVMPKLRVLLLDSLNKRVNFLNTVIENLKLDGITAVHGRAEEFSKQSSYREKFDIATARAVANMRVLSEYCIPYVKTGGHFIAMKGPSGYEELSEAKNAIAALGGNVKDVIETEITGEELKHNIIIVEKTKSTPSKYPRKPAQMEKSPIK